MKSIKLYSVASLLLIVLALNAAGQDTTAIIVKKADTYFDNGDYERAVYYYKLAARNKSELFENQIERKIFISDSLLAHIQPRGIPYTYYINKADSLYFSGNNLLALKEYDKAYAVSGISEYPRKMIQRIIAENPSIQKQLLVIHAKKMKSEYDFRMAVAHALTEKENYFLAMEEYDNISTQFSDEYAKHKRDSVRILLGEAFDLFSKALASANDYWMSRDYPNARLAYEEARKINPDCSICHKRLNYSTVEHHLKSKQITDTVWLRNQLEDMIILNDFSAALVYCQYLINENPDDLSLKETQSHLTKALSQQQAQSEAQTLLDKADSDFKKGKKEDAAKLYQMVINYYPSAGNLSEYAKLRLSECE